MNKVKELCVRRGIDPKEIVYLVGVSQPTVSDWFNQKKNPSGKRLEKLSEVLGVSRSVILGYDDDPMAPALAVDVSNSMANGAKTDNSIDKLHAKLEKLNKDNRAIIESNIDFFLERQGKGET